ncbi:MAG: hypothetical protein HUK26_08260, partial [Duodenibacillus sp.]|nr:hypothetical protein [Duodenibacillus sp.]
MPIDTPIDLPVRPAFWNVPVWAEVGVYVLAVVVVAFLAYSVRQGLRKTRAHCTAPDSPAGRDGRISFFLAEVLGQRRILRTAAGKAHAAVFWGFLLLFAGTATATLDWDVGHYVFGGQFLKGPVYLAFKLALDLAGLAALAGLGFAACRRFIRLDPRVEPTREAAAVLGYLAGIILTGFLVEALRLAVQDPAWGPWSPAGWA